MDQPIENLIESYQNADIEIEELKGKIETLTHSREIIAEEVARKIIGMGLNGLTTKNKYRVETKESISVAGVEMSVARELGATKMQETKDLTKLRNLYKEGIKVKGIMVRNTIFVKEAK